ncbi:MAG: hypothetical protein EHM58_11595 [Ignavibacteriae bacterium]|nr:MAG: hypothetical protein EHM58_11595 [Ignavibacteriota bacterium]
MKMGIGGWIGIIVGGLGGLIGMAVAIAASPLFGSIFSLFFIIVFGGVFWMIFRPMMVQNKLMKTGVPAQATILGVSDTGVTVNNSPQIKLLLQVSPPTGMPYQVETKLLISRLQTYAYQPGMTIAVKIDPNDKDKIAIDYSGGADSASAYSSNGGSMSNYTPQQIQDMTAMISKINDENMKLMAYGESARAIVTKYTPMGINVNGENPAVTLELEVLPQSRSPFKATAKGVIMATSIPKFQPGEEIFVKFDPNNIAKVTVEHS